jgi:hypothetical protein
VKRLAFTTLLFLGGGCAHRAATGLLVLHASPPDARVLLDDRYIGSAAVLSSRPMRINVGHRRLEISAEGHYAVRRDAEIAAGRQLEVTVELHRVPEGMRGD